MAEILSYFPLVYDLVYGVAEVRPLGPELLVFRPPVPEVRPLVHGLVDEIAVVLSTVIEILPLSAFGIPW